MRAVRRFRKSLDIYRRQTQKQQQLQEAKLREFFKTPSPSTSMLPRLSRQNLVDHVRQVAHIALSRKAIYKTYREYYPLEMQKRLRDFMHRRKGWTIPGPNYIWSVDGYCKLQHYGIKIYAAIDAYSRYIMWFHCGTAALSEVHVLRQYIKAVGEYNYIPMIMRANKGHETVLIAAAH
ncbi:hypothetical protein F5X96DRAFT_617240 [Biscogniauxia mediterranea]|nr:hypothetical protein F5X96DRAFT_617240 [Biscogniauxia mediterranea]